MPSEDRSKAVFSKYGPKFVKIPSFKILANLQTKMVANQMAVDSHLKVLMFGLKFVFWKYKFEIYSMIRKDAHRRSIKVVLTNL